MKKILLITSIIFCTYLADAQQWSGSTTISGTINRDGNVFMGNLSNRQYMKITSSEWPELRFQSPTSDGNIRIGVSHGIFSQYNIQEGDFYVYTYTGTQGKMPFIVRKGGDISLNSNVDFPHDKTFGGGTGTAVKMWGIRGQAGSNQRLELYDRVSIGYPSGWNNFPEPPEHGLYVHGNSEMGNLSQRHYFKVTSKEWPEVRFETPTSNEQIRIGVAHSNSSNYGVEEGDFYVYTQTANEMPFVVRRNGDLRFNLKGGSVGIGTATTGTHKLAVEGTIGAREIKVEASGWSDFVSEEDYELRTLEEVDQHINENGHLPEIPSEIEVTENGINLGEMDAKLLQKIEELTLYLIEQNKQNQSQQAEIEELKRMNIELLKRLENK